LPATLSRIARSGLLAACFVTASVLAGQAQRGNRLGVATIDSEAAARGTPIYVSNCAFCHGADARGAQAPDLAQSLYVQSDDEGRSFAEFMRVGRTVNGMPAFPQLSAANLSDLTAFLKSKIAEGRGRGGFDPASIVVGNAQRGEAYFNGVGQCRTCHSPAGDFKGVGAKYSAVILQGRMVNPRIVAAGRGVAVRPPPRPAVRVTLQSGRVVSGELIAVTDFFVTLVDRAGDRWTFDRDNDVPKVEITDPMEAHRQQLLKYTDEIMHDLVAYLASLK